MKLKTQGLRLFLFCFLSINFSLFSQVNVQFNSLNEYMFSTKEAMNLTVIYSGTKSVEVNFNGRISRPDEGTVVEFKSEPYVLNPGSNFITPMTVSIRDINYFNKDIAEIELKTGTYPSGNYSVCIWTTCTSPDCNGSGSGAGNTEQPVCTQIHIENPTPLILSYPEDDTEIEETRPIYTWIPPAPVAGSSGLNYMMTLVEIMDGQSKSDALSINRPLIEIEGLTSPMLMHPSDLPELEEGKSYAWQVQAFVGQTYFARSEQWKFKVKKEIVKRDTVMYAEMTGRIDAGAYKVSEDGYLYFIYNDPKPNYTLNIKVVDTKLKAISSKVEQMVYNKELSKDENTTKVDFLGQGKFRINIAELNLKAGYYYVQLVNSANEVLLLKFIVE